MNETLFAHSTDWNAISALPVVLRATEQPKSYGAGI